MISNFRQVAARAVLVIGMIGPGLFLAFTPHRWTTTLVLNQALGMSMWLVALTGALLAIGGLAVFWEATRDFAYAYASLFYSMIFLAAVISLFQGNPIGALFLANIIPIWAYAEACVTSVQRRELSIGRSSEEPKE